MRYFVGFVGGHGNLVTTSSLYEQASGNNCLKNEPSESPLLISRELVRGTQL